MTNTPVDPIVEMRVNGVWTEITHDCRLASADSGGGLDIKRGRANESPVVEPTEFEFTLNNGPSKVPATLGRTGCYSPRNPLGPYFGYLGRNQAVRVGINRRQDPFTRAVSNGLGAMPAKTTVNGDVVPAMPWRIGYSFANTFSVNGSEAVIIGNTGGVKLAAIETPYADVDIRADFKCTTRDVEFGLFSRLKPMYLTPPAGIDPTFETGVANWTVSNSTPAINTATPHSGSQCASLTATVSTSTVAFSPVATTNFMWGGSVVSGGAVRCRAWVRVSAARNCGLTLIQYDENGVNVGTLNSGSPVAVAANTWTVLEFVTNTTQDVAYLRPSISMQSPAAGDVLLVDDVEVYDETSPSWMSCNFVPGGTDIIKIGKIAPSTNKSITSPLAAQLVVNTYYTMRAQVQGRRFRMKFWKTSDPEPALWPIRYYDNSADGEGQVGNIGHVAFFANGGTGNVSIDNFQVDQWRAHTEITSLPPRWDLSRSDRWVPVSSRGILRRYGQGRKALSSAVTLYLETYSSASYGWWPLEGDEGDTAGNRRAAGIGASISGLSFGTPDLTGNALYPGVSGYASLDADNSYFLASIPTHASPTLKETLLFAIRTPSNVASDTSPIIITSTGTVRKWTIKLLAGGGLAILGTDSSGTAVVNQTPIGFYGLTEAAGSWMVCTLYLFTVSGTTTWAFNWHKPGSPDFWTQTGTYSGSTGIFTGVQIRGAAALTAVGGLQLSQVMHYAGDLPFVSTDFASASYAYYGETAGVRFNRLGNAAGINTSTSYQSPYSEAMGYQLPAKTLDLMAECADAEGGIMTEERDDFGLCLITRVSLWNRTKHRLDIDKGHLTEPLEPVDDDQGTRNDVTVSRANGGFARSIQTTGKLNVNPPEVDPVNGVGTYDESPTFNQAYDAQLQPTADFRRSTGTLDVSRYPSMHADFTAVAYQASLALTNEIASLDTGEVIDLLNPEVAADPSEQMVQGYIEHIDLYEWDTTWTVTPADTYRVGIVGYTTRADTEYSYTTASFVSGTNTKLSVQRSDSSAAQWVDPVTGQGMFPFDIDVAGVRLRVESVGSVLSSDADFEDKTLVKWAAANGSGAIATDRSVYQVGTRSCRVTCTTAGSVGVVSTQAAAAPVVAGGVYLAQGYLRADLTVSDARITVDWYQSDGTTLISTASVTPVALAAGVWSPFNVQLTAPALAAFARVKALGVLVLNGKMWVDAMKIVLVSSYTTDPQILTVAQVPVNGVIKTIASGSNVRLANPWRVAW